LLLSCSDFSGGGPLESGGLLAVQTIALELFDLAYPVKILAALTPTVPVFCMLVVTVKNYREMDEFMQRVQGESLLWTIGFICFLSFGYGLLEMVLGVVPPIGVIWILPSVCVGSGLMNVILMRRYHAE
jgi:4-amino-4-deoxy-L-arabinose transferase-like glycosyltransferase